MICRRRSQIRRFLTHSHPELSKYISYQFGGLVMDALTVRAVLYSVLGVIMFPLARLGFKKHQVA